jgi:hypothetical protein
MVGAQAPGAARLRGPPAPRRHPRQPRHGRSAPCARQPRHGRSALPLLTPTPTWPVRAPPAHANPNMAGPRSPCARVARHASETRRHVTHMMRAPKPASRGMHCALRRHGETSGARMRQRQSLVLQQALHILSVLRQDSVAYSPVWPACTRLKLKPWSSLHPAAVTGARTFRLLLPSASSCVKATSSGCDSFFL